MRAAAGPSIRSSADMFNIFVLTFVAFSTPHFFPCNGRFVGPVPRRGRADAARTVAGSGARAAAGRRPRQVRRRASAPRGPAGLLARSPARGPAAQAVLLAVLLAVACGCALRLWLSCHTAMRAWNTATRSYTESYACQAPSRRGPSTVAHQHV